MTISFFYKQHLSKITCTRKYLEEKKSYIYTCRSNTEANEEIPKVVLKTTSALEYVPST